MRNLILILVLANLLVYFWFQWLETPQVNDGSRHRLESQLLPRLDKQTPASEALAAEPAVLCVSIGDFTDQADADQFATSLPAGAGEATVVEQQREVFVGHWVQVVDIETRRAADEQSETLKRGGLDESYLTGNDASGYVVSLGLFTDLSRAEAVQAKARSLGVDAITLERTRLNTVYRLHVQQADAELFGPLMADFDQLSAHSCTNSAPPTDP
ncbi:MAG: hypothetical protein AAF385_08550 [Pseudomonadota bacterium]